MFALVFIDKTCARAFFFWEPGSSHVHPDNAEDRMAWTLLGDAFVFSGFQGISICNIKSTKIKKLMPRSHKQNEKSVTEN